ncbi:type VI secretion system-associated protein TagF [Amaricoccus solimangrovi]|nr:type VI secretion system-associated protein TagF [Amaricoccus solimangrovi]
MSGPVLNAPGFFGKLPATGDFVSRGLSGARVAALDRWISRHVAPRGPAAAFCFLHPALPTESTTGVVLPSRDGAGRAFPLTLAAPGGLAPAIWYAALAEAGEAAARGGIDADTLAARLAAFPPPPKQGAGVQSLLLWRLGETPRAIDPEAPGAAFDRFLATTGVA